MANPLQGFIDTQLGIVVATTLHTLGAIGFLGGLIGYLAWHRTLLHGHAHPRLLVNSAFITYFSIVVNLLGGFMRTFQGDHPELTEFASNPWVRVIFIKHLFLFMAMGASVYLFEVVAPKTLRALKTKGALPARGHRVGVFLVVLGIVLAAVLGALTQVPPFLLTADAATDEEAMHQHVATVYENASGQLTSTPVAPDSATGTFDVAQGTVTLQATLVWQPEQFGLGMDLADPAGGGASRPPASGGQQQVTVEAPAVGLWSYSIASDLAVGVTWTLSISMSSAPGAEAFLADSTTIAPGTFLEINTEMEEGGSLHWSWRASGTMHFNIHSHFDDKVQDWVDEDADHGEGTYTNERKGGYSYLWENTGALPVTVDYRVWGDFEVDSVVG